MTALPSRLPQPPRRHRRVRPILANEPPPRPVTGEVHGESGPMVDALAAMFARVREEYGVEVVEVAVAGVESEER